MKLSDIANIVQGHLQGEDAFLASSARRVIDSRVVQVGDCFFAIKGESFDGHDFLESVANKKAAVVIVDRPVSLSMPVIQVKDTKKALRDLAAFCRDQVDIPVIGITGSCGKTTTRALIENILKQKGSVLASQKSFNNDIGVPLTLFELKPTHDFAVIEIGTNHPGEIPALTAIAKPDISVITMIAGVHLEGFGTLDKIAEEKSAIYNTAKTVIINADDAFSPYFHQRTQGKKMITFGINNDADITADNISVDVAGQPVFTLQTPAKERVTVNLPLLGAHNVTNALAAAAIAIALDIPLEKIKEGLETAAPEYGRLNIKTGINKATIIDDSYNANPSSVKAAIDILTGRDTNTIFVFGDMKELGEMTISAHQDIGAYAKEKGVKKMFCYGEQSALAAKAFGEAACHFMDQDALITALKPYLTEKTSVLVKGSNGMKMNNIVERLCS